EERLRRAERLETAGRIAAQVAHDFNNLLAPLMGFPELIKQHLPAGNQAIEYCDLMTRAAEQMAQINQDLLTLGRRGHFRLDPVGLFRSGSMPFSKSSTPAREFLPKSESVSSIRSSPPKARKRDGEQAWD